MSDATNIRAIQTALSQLNYDPGPIDGILGPKTHAATRAFQADHPPLVVDGIPGPQTQTALVAAVAAMGLAAAGAGVSSSSGSGDVLLPPITIVGNPSNGFPPLPSAPPITVSPPGAPAPKNPPVTVGGLEPHQHAKIALAVAAVLGGGWLLVRKFGKRRGRR